MSNSLLKIQAFGQSIWLDFIRRGMIKSGELQQYIEEDGLKGITSNPSIFEKAIDGSKDYDETIKALARDKLSSQEIYERLIIEDLQKTADIFRTVYKQTHGRDGYVSLEVSPHLARDTEETIKEARRLWKALDRPNVMIKVPATREGLFAIKQLISEGINVNVTLLFSLSRYRAVTKAYLSGLEERAAAGKSLDGIASVASFFLSRIDSKIDPLLDTLAKEDPNKAGLASSLVGQLAVASAKIAYQTYKEIFSSARFQNLEMKGAYPQRLLWASTSTKNPSYSDVKYVEELIGPETVSTVPLVTLNAYRDHGDPDPRLKYGIKKSNDVIIQLAKIGISLDEITDQLENEGIEKFTKSYDRLIMSLHKKTKQAVQNPAEPPAMNLGQYHSVVNMRFSQMEKMHFGSRLWRIDPTLWKSDPLSKELIRKSLGWLHVAEKMKSSLPELNSIAKEIREAGFRHVVHLGMGGSSLAAMVFQKSFLHPEDGIPLTVLDTTDPATILKVEQEIPLKETFFIVASKSGTTAETRALDDYFFSKIKQIKKERAGEHFAAITDPGTPLVSRSKNRKFRRIFLNFPDIGGRYSALSYFGLVPAILSGVNVEELLERALRMAHACASCVAVTENPGLSLGGAIGELTRQGRDKLTFLLPDSLSTLGLWLEQLFAESTGKQGTGVLPVVGEELADFDMYRDDRVFVHFVLEDEPDEFSHNIKKLLIGGGHPVLTVHLRDMLDVGQEFFRWEIAAAAAGAILGINAFDQPNVEESKENTRELLEQMSSNGKQSESNNKRSPSKTGGFLKLTGREDSKDADGVITTFLGQLNPGDFIAFQIYLPEESAIHNLVQEIRHELRDHLNCATTVGYGPRYLHSTGQYQKGGPNNDLILQLTAQANRDVEIPGKPYSFGKFKQAQAMGDFKALQKHKRRVLRIDLGQDAVQGLKTLRKIVEKALEENLLYA